MEGTWKERKEARTKQFNDRFKRKMIVCSACNGSGYYDDRGYPRCASCNGTGKILGKRVDEMNNAP